GLIHGKLSHARVAGTHTEIWSGTGLEQMAQALDETLARYNRLSEDAHRDVWSVRPLKPGGRPPEPQSG
ncbi:hypothetical protein, partial [Rhodoplanes roseus]